MSLDRLLGRVRVVDGTLQPFDPASYREAALHWSKVTAWVRLEDEERVHTRQQEKFWHGVVVRMIEDQWMREMKWAARPAKGFVHGKLVELCFGTFPTPEGPSRRSSTGLTLKEYSELIDWADAYLWEKYETHVPQPGEVME